jgi:hypothetical protein
VTDDLAARLAEPDGWRSVDVELGAALRAGDAVGVEQRLRRALEGRDDAVAEACLRLDATEVSLVGWERLDAEVTRYLRRDEGPVTAVGLDLSNYGDGPGEWWDKEPYVEVALYDDSSFPFSTARPEELLAASVSYAAPWTGCMIGVEMTPLLTNGLRVLNGLLLRRQADEIEGDEVSDRLGWWWQALRFHQAVHRSLSQRGLALQVPVVVGEHDCGPWVVTTQVPARVSDHLASTEALLAEWAAENRAWYDAHTEETVAEIVELRNGLKGWGWRNRDKRQNLARYADARIALVCSIVGIETPRRSVERMSDAELARFVDDYRAARAGR